MTLQTPAETEREQQPDLVVIDADHDEVPAAATAPAPASAAAGRPLPARRWAARLSRKGRPVPGSVAVYGAALSILAALLLGFAADLSFLGSLQHYRSQKLAYADLRLQLASGEAPIGAADSNGVLLAAGTPIAVMSIPTIGLTEVVFEGSTSRVLAKGAGHERLTPMPGQAGTSWIMGRRAAFGGPFRDLGVLHAGDPITVTTGQGVSTFRVLDVRRAGDPQPAAAAAGAGRLQLITATGPAFQPTGVLRVDADLTSPVLGTPPALSGVPPLAKAEQPLQGDASVLTVLVLWSQALLVAAGLVAWARVRWGLWQAWIVGVPLLATLGIAVADRAAQLLPNLM